jgi:hypothetical protein
MDNERLFQTFGQTVMKGGRSTVVTPLVLVIVALIGGACVSGNTPMGYVFAAMGGVVILAMLGVYGVCFWKNDLKPLCSERHNVIQTAMQKPSLKGDDLKTIVYAISERDETTIRGLPAPTPQEKVE